jgi:hypothetical protein
MKQASRRFESQIRARMMWAPGISVFAATVGFFLEWAGYNGRRPWGPPQPFRAIWWHFFVIWGCLFAFFMLWPRQEP